MEVIQRIVEATAKPEIVTKLFEVLEGYQYCFIGGMAVSFFSETRRRISMNDLDLLVVSGDAQELKSSLEAAGLEFKRKNEFDGKLWFVFESGTQEVDVAVADDPLSIHGVKNAQVFTYHGVPIRIVDPGVLITMKVIAGREKDHVDIIYVLKSLSSSEIKAARQLVKKYAGDRLEEYDQLVEDATQFDYELLGQMVPA